MASNKVEGWIKMYEAALNQIRPQITKEGDTTAEVQQVIDEALDELLGWYEYRKLFG
ncbi:hypothetical protein IC229_27430 [Spirosoma sp. BT702]|uniref:Uncharacterized protein n=1 Tax=Spirosoma profusum TaxID=2771354 RepID=A0A926Y4C0_9BACT|nr:hypothetical protein [Spirosoma profusum]MBD2704403.1 hypothetical protein [Spirosoma profusum]